METKTTDALGQTVYVGDFILFIEDGRLSPAKVIYIDGNDLKYRDKAGAYTSTRSRVDFVKVSHKKVMQLVEDVNGPPMEMYLVSTARGFERIIKYEN